MVANFLDKLFKKKSTIYQIELDDIKINDQITQLIVRAENNLSQLDDLIKKREVINKDYQLSELENSFQNMKSKVDVLKTDLQRILDIEIYNKDYITVHDEGFLEDKFARLNAVSEALDDLIGLMTSKPPLSELRDSLLANIYDKINAIITSIRNIINDDKHLEDIYAKITEL